ncbi:MAG TPA: radical SAM protein [Syntrophorhabdaceae bacterium]|jgi:DNA repair photolyase
MDRREIIVKSILTRTGIEGFDYCINPYVGCEHSCAYCYATFMKRFTGHMEPWGSFVDVKVNGPEVLRRQVARKKGGSLLVGTVTDPYQPAEREYRITRGCLEALRDSPFEVNILTRSPLCTRDKDLFKALPSIKVGITVTTDSDEVRELFEPSAPPIESRVKALKVLHGEGIRTYAFIGPMLPLDPDRLAGLLYGVVDEVCIDKLNYSRKVIGLYRLQGLTRFLEEDYFVDTAQALKESFEKNGVAASVFFDCCGSRAGSAIDSPNESGGWA